MSGFERSLAAWSGGRVQTEEWYDFYGADGRLLVAYKQNGDQVFDLRLRRRKAYFMGKLTHEWRPPGGGQLAVVDGRVLCRGQTALSAPLGFRTEKSVPYPYGEEQGAGTGRFLTADPYRASGGAGDPVNFVDPSGLQVLPEPYLGVGIGSVNSSV